MTFPAFKAGDAFLRGTGGGFDFHTPPPILQGVLQDTLTNYPELRGYTYYDEYLDSLDKEGLI